MYKDLMGGNGEKGAGLFSVVSSHRTRGNEHKRKCRVFLLNTRRHFSAVRVTKCWHRLPRKIVESPSVEMLRTCLDSGPQQPALPGPA